MTPRLLARAHSISSLNWASRVTKRRFRSFTNYEPAWCGLSDDCVGGEHSVEIDECLVNGATRGEGRGTHHKSTAVGAVEVRMRKDAEGLTAK
jgi:hypothetical protein